MALLLAPPAALRPHRLARRAAPRVVAAAAVAAPHAARRQRAGRCRCSETPSAADAIAAGPVGAATPLREDGRPTAAEEIAVMAAFGSVKWYECLVGVAYAILMSEVLRFCVEAAAPLASKLFAGALLALLFDFGIMAFMQMRGSRAAADKGRDVRAFRALLALKIAAELAGAALVTFRGAGAAGAACALAGHLVFNWRNDVFVSPDGAVKAFPRPARQPLIVTDAALTAVCALGVAAPGLPALVAGGVFATFASVYCFFKFILGRKI